MANGRVTYFNSTHTCGKYTKGYVDFAWDKFDNGIKVSIITPSGTTIPLDGGDIIDEIYEAVHKTHELRAM